MNNFAIFTDSGCDISLKMLSEWNVKVCSLTFTFDGDEKQYSNYDLTPDEFYSRMKNGEVAKTAGINSDTFKDAFEEELKLGNDVLYMGISSGISVTYSSAHLAADELKEKYPERNIIAIDTLCASAGLGLMLYLASNMRKSGSSIEETAEYIESKKLSLCHWFTVDDLTYLKRGGRISPTVALIGGLLNIKPVLHVDNEGHLINITKVRGRKAAIKALADKYGELISDTEAPVFISQGDCPEDAESLSKILREKYNATVDLIADIGPVIGAHAGPGTLALFFIGKER